MNMNKSHHTTISAAFTTITGHHHHHRRLVESDQRSVGEDVAATIVHEPEDATEEDLLPNPAPGAAMEQVDVRRGGDANQEDGGMSSWCTMGIM